MRLPRFISLRCLTILICFGIFLVIISTLIEYLVENRKIVSERKQLVELNIEEKNFNKAFQRLLDSHKKVYDPSNAECSSGGNLEEKNEQLLENVRKLLPQLQNKLILYPNEYFKGRGIVLTVGNDQLLHTKINLRIIEWLKTELPVEVWYSSLQLTDDIINDLLNYVPKLNVKACSFEKALCYSLNGKQISIPSKYIYLSETKNVQGKIYSFKLSSIISSTFEEIIFVDSDCYIVRDPIYLFENDPMYKKFGSLFYPDIYMSHQHSKLWKILNTTCVQNEFSLDSGALVLNKKFVWNGIYMAKLMGDYHQIFYEYFISHGDKDTFRLAFRYMKINYYIVGIPCSTGFIRKTSFCGVTLCKTDSLGLNIYFDHIHHPKHMHDFTFLKENFTHTRVALTDHHKQSFITGYCGLHPLPCFQVGFQTIPYIGVDEYCRRSALIYDDKPLVKISSSQTALWNPNVETKRISMKKSDETMPGYIDFYFKIQTEPIFKNHKL